MLLVNHIRRILLDFWHTEGDFWHTVNLGNTANALQPQSNPSPALPRQLLARQISDKNPGNVQTGIQFCISLYVGSSQSAKRFANNVLTHGLLQNVCCLYQRHNFLNSKRSQVLTVSPLTLSSRLSYILHNSSWEECSKWSGSEKENIKFVACSAIVLVYFRFATSSVVVYFKKTIISTFASNWK